MRGRGPRGEGRRWKKPGENGVFNYLEKPVKHQLTTTATIPDLDTLALAFVVQVQGSWTPEARATWQEELLRQGCEATENDIDAALEQACRRFETGTAHLFLCTGKPCRQRQKFDLAPEVLQRLSDARQLLVTPTECQGPCKQAPVATLRAGQRCEMFAQFMRETDWQAVTDFSARAVAAGTVLIPPGAEQPFRFDPVHTHESHRGPLQDLQFLIGHFHGTSTYADGTGGFVKEMVGHWEVSGRFLGIRMGVTYPLSDGQKDTHTALAVLGVNPDSGDLEGRVYTDGGALHDYHLEMDGDALTFRDRPEGHHGVEARRARKIFQPTSYGFEERLELDPGTGQFELYYRIPMQRA